MGKMKETKNCQGFNTSQSNFLSGLDRASEIVSSWPTWKQTVLGSSIPNSKNSNSEIDKSVLEK